MKKKLFILDAYGFIFRAYHIQPKNMEYKGFPTGAIYGFARMLLKVIRDFQPKYFVAAFDSIKTKNFRYDIYKDYKANRPPLDEELKKQLPITRKIAQTFGIPIIEADCCEADDIIASLCNKYKKDFEINIISSDKDLMQLIDTNIIMYDPIKAKYIKTQEVINKFGVSPDQIVDFLSLIGDKSDNIPGVKKIGPKTAAILLQEYSSLENILKNVDNFKKGALIEADKNNVLLSKELIKLKYDIKIQDSQNINYQLPNYDAITEMLQQYGFFSLSKYIDDMHQLYVNNEINHQIQSATSNIIIIDSVELLENIIVDFIEKGICLLNTDKDKIYFSSIKQEEIYMIDNIDIIISFINFINKSFTINIAYNLKSILHICNKYDISIKSRIDDVMLCYYVAFNGISPQNLIDIAYKTLSPDKYKNLSQTNIIFTKLIYDIYSELKKKLISTKNYSIYATIELPISPILFDMEKNGIELDIAQLNSMDKQIEKEIKISEKEIFHLANTNFNLQSTQQLSDILFIKLKLPYGVKTQKTGHLSTSVEVLEKLHIDGYLIATYLLKWRHLTKLKNTYTASLPKYINKDTNRIHTTFTQVNTVTGRLSSLNPNLQNIPIKSDFHIRKAFISKSKSILLSSDYSQIELRIFAKIANITPMLSEFNQKEDIHTQTAMEIFQISQTDVTALQRRKAKIINFGIIYGAGPFGIAKQLKIGLSQAKIYLDTYHAKYPQIKQYFQNISNILLKQDYIENIFGRRCNIPIDLNFNNRLRMAINAPIQSTASEIVKLAMIKLYSLIQKKIISAKMLLQVHDEIIFEINNKSVENCSEIIKSTMENITEKYLNIEIPVNIKIGDNWDL